MFKLSNSTGTTFGNQPVQEGTILRLGLPKKTTNYKITKII